MKSGRSALSDRKCGFVGVVVPVHRLPDDDRADFGPSETFVRCWSIERPDDE